MKLVDSDVWSEALRSQGGRSWQLAILEEAIEADEIVMIGPVRQEILSGIRHRKQFEKIRDLMKAFPSRQVEDSVHELAAAFFNTCRAKGIQGSHTDFLICACSVAWKVEILTKDKDFEAYAKHLPILLASGNAPQG